MDRNICVNQVYRDVRTDKQFRLLWKAPRQAPSYIYWLDEKTTVPKMIQLDELDSGIQDGWIVEEEDAFAVKADVSEKDRQHRDAIWKKMKSALLDEPGIYDKKIRSEHLRRIERESGETIANLYRHLGRYWQRGKTPDAFLPGYSASGGRGKYRVGRTYVRKDENSEFGKTLTPADLVNFEAAIRKYYLSGEKSDLAQVYDGLLKDSYTVLEKDEKGEVKACLLPKGELPSIRQFRYWYSKRRDLHGGACHREQFVNICSGLLTTILFCDIRRKVS